MREWRFKLLYDGECPLCLREVRFLNKLNRHGLLAFEDITAPGFDPQIYGTTREELMGVIHGVFPDGRMVRKMEVFREAYRAVGLGWPTGVMNGSRPIESESVACSAANAIPAVASNHRLKQKRNRPEAKFYFNDAMSMTKRYFTSFFTRRS